MHLNKARWFRQLLFLASRTQDREPRAGLRHGKAKARRTIIILNECFQVISNNSVYLQSLAECMHSRTQIQLNRMTSKSDTFHKLVGCIQIISHRCNSSFVSNPMTSNPDPLYKLLASIQIISHNSSFVSNHMTSKSDTLYKLVGSIQIISHNSSFVSNHMTSKWDTLYKLVASGGIYVARIQIISHNSSFVLNHMTSN